MLELVVLADDLTGGMITASALEAVGVRCPLVTSVEALSELPPGTEAVVLARKIRLIDPALAKAEARAAAEAFKALGAKRLYYKYSGVFDCTPRGNIGPIAEELLHAVGARQTIFCGALIERDVTVYEGRMFLRNMLLADSPKRFDPVTPAFESNLVEALQPQTTLAVGLLPHRILFRGRAAAEAELARLADTPFIIVDAVDKDDIDRIAELVLDWPLVTGADSLTPALARAWKKQQPKTEARGRLLPAVGGFSAVLCGSCAPATLEQLDHFAARHPVWRIDLAKDADKPGLVDAVAAWAIQRLPEGPVAIATSGDKAAVAQAQARFGVDGASQRSDRLIGDIGKRLHDAGVRQFVVAGGETSGQVMSALGVRQVVVAPEDDMLGGYCHAPGADGVSLVLKPGTYGDPNFLFSALARLEEAEAAGASLLRS
jgi:uncharacterized protein YgbK (DUF1537 family)